MIMKKLFSVITVFLLVALLAKGQDIVVLKDGSTIKAKVLEINKEDVRYKKYSNLDGPTYTISKFDIFSINYEKGEKDLFSTNNVSVLPIKENAKAISQNDSYINDGIISDYNDRTVVSKLKRNNKKAKWVYRLLKVHPSSVVGNSDGRLHLNITQERNSSTTDASMCVSIENTSNEMMYVDLGSSSFRELKSASTYFINSSTTRSSSSNGGGAVNLGSIASVLGLGGPIGTLAGGTTVGGGNSSGSSTTIYAERIITIAPHSVYRLKNKQFYNSALVLPYKNDFMIGDRFTYYCPTDLAESPWEIIISYAMEKNLNEMKKMDMGIYISEEISVEPSWDKCFEKNAGLPPIHYYYRVK